MEKFLFKITTADKTIVGVTTCAEDDLEDKLAQVALREEVEPLSYEAIPVEDKTVYVKI